jgi:hypothetical protein
MDFGTPPEIVKFAGEVHRPLSGTSRTKIMEMLQDLLGGKILLGFVIRWFL